MVRTSRRTAPPATKPKRRPRRRKPAFEDKVRAVLIAAACICGAAFIGAAVLVIQASIPKPLPELPSETEAAPVTEPPAQKAPDSETVPAISQTAPAGAPAPQSPPVRRSPPQTPPVSPPEPAAGTAAAAEPARPQAAPSGRDAPRITTALSPPASRAVPERGQKSRGTVVFMIDDAGNNLRELEPFLKFPGPLTIAVLPGLPHSAEAARRIRAAGKEVFLHQPMEALGGQNPGPGAIYAEMGPAEIRAVVEKNLAELGPVAGMNNHQGSKITMDERIMETILKLCKERGICFLDSRTTAETAVPAAAARLGVTIGERDVFLDNIQERTSMIRYVEDGLARAERKGKAVMIGHTWSPELAPVLTELYGSLLERGYSLTTASGSIKP